MDEFWKEVMGILAKTSEEDEDGDEEDEDGDEEGGGGSEDLSVQDGEQLEEEDLDEHSHDDL